jgi:hypothetical protein
MNSVMMTVAILMTVITRIWTPMILVAILTGMNPATTTLTVMPLMANSQRLGRPFLCHAMQVIAMHTIAARANG